MYKKIMIIVTLFLLISCFSVAHAQESIEEEEKRNTSIEDIIAEQAKSRNVTDILDSLEEYSPDEIYRYFNGISFNDLFQDALTGRFTPDLNGLFKSVMDFMTYEIKKNLVIIVYVLIISIIYSVIASMADSSGVKGVKDITGTVCYGAIILIIVRSYMDTVRMTGTMIGDLSGLVMSVTPLMISLLAASGNVVGATTMSPVMMFYSQFCVVAAEKYFLPDLFGALNERIFLAATPFRKI
jgi:stage III sporulation protein AE